jgi:hypothetical protein
MESFVGKLSRVFGWISLGIAGFLAAVLYHDHHSGVWFANLFDWLFNRLIAIFATLGVAGIGYAAWSERKTKNLKIE